MRKRSIHVLSALLGLLAAHALASGCGIRVKLGDDSAGGGGPAPGVGGASPRGTGGGGAASGTDDVTQIAASGVAPSPAGPGVIALLRSQFPPPAGTAASAASTGGQQLDPDDLFILLGDPMPSCVNPSANLSCPGWKVSIIIPPALQVPGLLDLDDPALGSHFTVNAHLNEGEDSCSFGGGTFWNGTIEIVRIDATEVVFRLSDTTANELDANGEHTALRCP